MNSLLDDSGFQNFDKHFEDLVKKFEQNNFSLGQAPDDGDVVGEYDWRETLTHQILVLKVKQVKNKPLDIKIEKGQIKLKGDVESVDLNNPKSKSFTKVHFERSFSIPAGVDQTKPEFENKAGELLIKFKKLKPSKTLPKANIVDPLKQQLPISKDQDDVTI
jgi:HSP20 family molecular chaperone IbpA